MSSGVRNAAPKVAQLLRGEDLARKLGLASIATDSALSHVGGHRCYALLGDLAYMERVLLHWTLSTVVKQHKFTPVSVPHLVYDDVVSSCGFDPHKERTQVYQIQGSQGTSPSSTFSLPSSSADGRKICLIGTSEIPLVAKNLGRRFDGDQLIKDDTLPLKMVSLSRCYRAETSQRERGLYRVHYFNKVEMVCVTEPGESSKMLSQLVSIQEDLFSQLGLKTRTVLMPPEDLGPVAKTKYDIESWFRGRGRFGEISSASDCDINQATKLNITHRRLNPDESNSSGEPFITEPVATVNATACATPRLLVALIEQYQEPETGRIGIPPVLQPLMGGKTHLEPLVW